METLDGGRIILGDVVRDGEADEVREGHIANDPTDRVLVTLTARHTEPLAALGQRLQLEVAGIAPLVWTGAAPSGDALVEQRPAGRTAEACAPIPRGPLCTLGARVADVLARAHDAGKLVLGVRPELIYVDHQHRFTGLVPRGPAFIASAPGVRFNSYTVPYAPYEVLALDAPVAASDVFALCASLFFIGTGAHPFGDPVQLTQLVYAILGGEATPWPEPGPLRDLLAAGMARDPQMRPSARDVAAALRAIA